jgi:hypothetical protein
VARVGGLGLSDRRQPSALLGPRAVRLPLADLEPVRRNFAPSDLRPLLAQRGWTEGSSCRAVSSVEETRLKGANIGVAALEGEGWEDRRHGLLLPLSRRFGLCWMRLS